jgi:transposase-like protein
MRERGTSKSAVSRRFVAMTAQQLASMLEADLGQLDLRAVMIDGLHFRDHVVIVALGIDSSGQKHVLGLWEGATENATTCVALLTSLRDRGMPTSGSMLVIIDGSKALANAVRDVFGEAALIQRCQLHKRRNVLDHLPESARSDVEEALRQTYVMRDAGKAKARLENLARRLEVEHPSAAESLREGLDETLTVMRIGLPEPLTRSLSTTNPIENLQGTIRRVFHRVDPWRGGTAAR